MKTLAACSALSFLILAASLVASPAKAEDLDISEDSYAAVAYSPETREMHYAYNYRSRRDAEQAALKLCKAKDAQVAGWVNHGFFALSVAEDGSWRTGWSYGGGSSNTEAQNYALEELRKSNKKGGKIVICLSSDGQYIYKP